MVPIYSRKILLFLFGTSLLFHVQFYLLLPDLHIGVSRGRSGGLVFPSLEEFPVFWIHTVEGFCIVNKAEIDVFLELSCFFDAQQWPQDWKGQFSFQSQRKAIPKNAQTTTQLHSSHMLVK